MTWNAIDRQSPAADDSEQPLLSEAVKEKIHSFFPRYPTRRAVLLPALHIVQETYGFVSHRAMRDIAELLEIPPSAVLDTISFYAHFWSKKRGRKTIVACRSLACQLLGADDVIAAIKEQLQIDEHETTADGEYSFTTEECLGACEYGACLLINEKLHKCVCAGQVAEILRDPVNDRLEIERSDLYDAPCASREERLNL